MWIKSIYDWNKERGLLENFNKKNEANMLQEEIDELKSASTEHDIVDALADIIVIAIGSLLKLKYKPNDVMYEVLKEINSRVGTINPERI